MKKLLLLLFVFHINGLKAQNNLKEAKTAVDTLFFSKKESALKLCDKFLPIAKKDKDTFHITYFLDQAGEINRFFGNLYDAEKQLKECLHFKKNWKDLKDLSLTHNNLGKTYKMMGKYELSLFHFIEALKLMEKDKNLIGQGFYLNNIATVFDEQQNYTKAIEYYSRSLTLKKETKDTTGIATTTYNLGISYFNLKNYTKALDYFNQSYISSSYQSNANKKARALKSIGQTYQKMGDYKNAKKQLLLAFNETKKVDDYILNSGIINALANAYLDNNQIDSAKILNLRAIRMIQNKGVSDVMQESLFTRSIIFQKTGELDSALFYLKEGNLYYDSLVSEANINAVANIEAKYNTERNLRQRKEIELKASETRASLQEIKVQNLYLILIIIVLITLGGIIFVKLNAKKRNLLLIEGQKRLITLQNNRLNQLNQSISAEVNTLKLSIQEKDNLLNNVFSTSQNNELPQELLDLSPREKEVLAHLALGLSNDQIAERLFVSQATVKTHLSRVFSKLLVKNRAEAVAIAHKYGIIGELIEV